MDLVGSVTQVVKIALQILELVRTVHQNKEDCKNIARRVEMLRAIVEQLKNTDVWRDGTMINALKELEQTFLRALKLVKACQAKNSVWLFLTAGNVSKQLREVNNEMLANLLIAHFSHSVQQTRIITEAFIRDPAATPKELLELRPLQQEQEIHMVGSRLVWEDTNICVDEELMEMQSLQEEQEIYMVGSRLEWQDTENCIDEHATGQVEDAHASYSTHVTRYEVHGGNEQFRAGSLEDAISRFRNFSSSELQEVTEDFSSVIGEGGSAVVYKGVLHNGEEVAIKWLCVDYSQVVLYAEVFSVLCEHENVVRFLGYCDEIETQMFPIEGKFVAAERHHMLVLVEEYMPNGSLSEIIDEKDKKLDWTSIFRIIRGIACGVAHIHMKGVAHLDLKPAHILLDSNMNPKICDFGRSRILTQELAGTLGYLPPEYIADGTLSFEHDVFSFGILLLQTISKSELLRDSSNWGSPSQLHFTMKLIWQALEEADDLEYVDGLFSSSSGDESEVNEIKRFMGIGLQCAAKEWTDRRPTMWDVVDMLDGEERLQMTPMQNRASSSKEHYCYQDCDVVWS
ncbi:hypothetical protein ACQJBY_004876 [Aegilops geniculata]